MVNAVSCCIGNVVGLNPNQLASRVTMVAFNDICELIQSSSSLSFKCALKESGCRVGYEPTKNESR